MTPGTAIMPAGSAVLAGLLAGSAPDGLSLPEGGIETAEVLALLRDVAAGIEPLFRPVCWLIVADGEVVGLCSIVRPPADGGIMIGYGIAPARRQRGHATAAVAAVLAWARDDARVQRVIAETAEGNLPSQRVLQACGLACTGRRDDPDDGAMLCWAIATPGPA